MYLYSQLSFGRSTYPPLSITYVGNETLAVLNGFDFNDLLTPTRPEDKGSDLWSVYNVVQEKLTHGLFNYKYGVKVRKARKIKNFNKLFYPHLKPSTLSSNI